MALYKIDRSRNLKFIGKFKFDYTVVLSTFRAQGSQGGKWTYATFNRGAYIYFDRGVETFQAACLVANKDANSDYRFFGNPFDQLADFGSNTIYYDEATGLTDIRFYYFLKGKTSQKGHFVLSKQTGPNSNDTRSDLGEITGGGVPYYRTIRGTIEGYVYDNDPLDEFVEISEYYPSEVQTRPGNCPGSTDEFWIEKKLDENLVRQWPKYTTLNWYESPDPKGKRTIGIYIKHTSSDGKISNFSASYADSPSFFTSYIAAKQLNAWSQDETSNSGYITVSSTLDYEQKSIIPARTDNVTVDLDNFYINSKPIGYGRQAQIEVRMNPTRNVSFESVVKDWNQNHTDELTAYLVGFNSDGVNKVYDELGSPHPAPTYETVVTKSGIISAKQTYILYESPRLRAREEGQDNSTSAPPFDNSQKWIFGMIDGYSSKDIFDDLDSPSKHYDFPDKYVTRRSLSGGNYCVNINKLSQDLTIDEFDLPSGSSSIPIPLRGWKFNALSLYQNKSYQIPGSGNIRDFTFDNGVPKYYGNQNLSGYRYLVLNIKSKTGNTLSGNLIISENTKGPTTSGQNSEEILKTWSINTSSQNFETIRIDLCNPDNKTEQVDDQDSPYPRLNTYTTSKPKTSQIFAYISIQNSPKEDFITLKPTKNSNDTKWITKAIGDKIASAGIVYITDQNNTLIDYFEVDSAKLPKNDQQATNKIFGKPRVYNGKIKLAKYWNSLELNTDPNYGKTLQFYIPKNDLTKGKTIYQLLEQDKDGKFPNEFQLYNYDSGYPDISDKVSTLANNYADNQIYMYVQRIPSLDNGSVLPYDAVIIKDTTTNVSRKYKIVQYNYDAQLGTAYFVIQQNSVSDPNLIFSSGKADIFLGFYAPESDDKFRTGFVKINSILKKGNIYEATIEYFKFEQNGKKFDSIPERDSNDVYVYFSNNTPVISTTETKLVEYTFPVDSTLQLYLSSNESSQNEINAIDDYPNDEASNNLYYGVSRINKISLDNEQIELGDIYLERDNSLSNFVISGNKNTFEYKTKFIVAENASTGVPTETKYYTRRFWQQSTDFRDEEEGDITWQNTPIKQGTEDSWTLFPKTISDLCEDINKIDEYVAPRWLDPSNPSSEILRHPGWVAKKVDKGITGQIQGNWRFNHLDPDYLNSDTGYASWIYGGGLLALPSGSNSGSGTKYELAINVNLNEIKNIIAQTIFHRINGDFPPGKPDLFGNTSLLNKDGTTQESTLHLRGGLIIRGPGHGLVLPPKESKPDDIIKVNLFKSSDNTLSGSDETDNKGFYETGTPYALTNISHYSKLQETERFKNTDNVRSSNRNFSQAKRERASFKPGVEKKVAVTSVSVVETGFEHSLLFAYTVPSKTPYETVVISTDSFFDPFYEKNPIGFKVSSGTGQTIKGAYPFLLSSELKRNKLLIPHSFVLTEFDSTNNYQKSSNYKSVIGANLNFRDKDTWYPIQGGNVDTRLDFNKNTFIFEKTKFNSFCLSDHSPQIYSVGYADPGALILQTTHLTMSNINSPNTDKVLHIDGKVPTDVAQFRLFEPITTVGTASTAFASVCQIKSNELIVSYSLQEEPRKIFYRIVSNNQVQAKNLLLDLDDLSGNVLNASYNIYGINSFYDKLSNVHKTTFMSNGNVYYHEFDINGSITTNTKTTLIHLIKGDLNDKLASALNNKQLLHKYFDSASGFASTIPTQRPGITACQKQSYASHTIIAYQTGKCKIEAVLFKPFKDTFISSRQFDIECPNETAGGTTGGTGGGTGGDTGGGTGGGTGGDTGGGTTGGGGGGTTGGGDGGNNNTSKPNAKFSADPTSGTKDLTVTFTNQSTPFNDLNALSKFKWDFYGDGSDLLETTTLDPFTYVYTRVGTFYPKLIAVDINNVESDVYNLVAITVNDVVNQPPTADFTFVQNTFLSPFSVAFSDISKDIDGTIASWNWNFGDGNTSSLQNPINDYNLQGTYNVKLTVTDNLGLSAEITKSVTVATLPNKPPVPDFTYSQRINTFTIDFLNNSIDPENDVLSYEWVLNEFDANSKSTLKDPSYTYQMSGIYNVTLKATDSNKNFASITKPVQVNDVINLAPKIIDVTYSQTSYDPLTIKFSENSIDDDGYIEQWEWNFGDNSTEIIADPTLKNTSHNYANPGTYIVTLKVTDNGLPAGINKKTASRSITVIVAPPPSNIPPVASFTVDKNNLPAIFTSTFTDQSTDSDGTIVSWLWQLPNNQNITFDTTNYSKTVSYTFTKSGTYTTKLTVTDNQGSSNTATQDIVVVNQKPTALLVASPNPILSKNSITLDASSSNDIDGNIVNYSWDFGDGVKKLSGSSIENYVYNFPGSYVASVTVTDNLGLQDTALVAITVQNRNPVAVITYDSLTVKAPNSLNFSGTSSYDEDGKISSYSWKIINKSTNVTYFTSVSSVISVAFTTQGFYNVSLTVTDNFGATNSTSVDVTVTPPDNIPPIAILNVDKISGSVNDTFNFNFRGSYDPDANGSIIRFIINYGDGVEETYTYAPLLVAHRYALPGVYVAKLVVIDNRFGRSLETVDSVKTITISNQAPVANFSVTPTTVYTFENVTLTDLSTDAENSIVKWTWNFGDGSPDLVITDPLLVNQTKQYSKGGADYIITLTVEDNFGLTNTAYKTVTVLNRKPIAVIKTDPLAVNNIVTVDQGTTVVFTSDSYDLDGVITSYEWNIVGITSAPITTKNFYRSFIARDALYEVTLRVMDDQNLWSDTVSVFIKVLAPNTPPVVYINANPPSGTASAPVTVLFDSNGTFDPDNPNELLTYFWDFGNGSYSSSPSSSTTYTKAGSYNVLLDVTDRRGSTTQRTLLYVVIDATNGGTTPGGTTPVGNTTGGNTTGNTTGTTGGNTSGTTSGGTTTGGNINNTPITPPFDTTTTTTTTNNITPPSTTSTTTTTTTTTPPVDTNLVTPPSNPPTVITGPPTTTTPPATTVTTPPTIDWFANPANQVPPASGPIIDPNIQGAQ